MRILVLHDRIDGEVRADEADVLVQRDVVCAALRALGHETSSHGCGLDLQDVADHLHAVQPDLVFNLVESIARTGRLIHLVPGVLDALHVRYTGAPAEAIFLSSSKQLGKRWLAASGLRTAESWTLADLRRPGARATGRVIVKSLWEHGSVGMDHDCVFEVDSAAQLAFEMERRLPALGGDAIAERYVDGREFNLSVLAGPEGPEVLPPAEIEFVDWATDRPRIVDWRAKWDEQSPEYQGTPRRFEFPTEDGALLAELRTMALQSWHAFALRGWARVDFRVDADGRPFVLEVNTNPCLSPDASFAAALARAGISFERAIARIVVDALR